MTDTEIVPRKRDREPADRPPLVDAELADELLARALAEEMSEHLGYDKDDAAGRGSVNSRNGTTGKRLLTEVGGIELEVPRGSQRVLQPADRAQGPDPPGRVQRAHHRLVRARAEHP
jgi:transposase-like protein